MLFEELLPASVGQLEIAACQDDPERLKQKILRDAIAEALVGSSNQHGFQCLHKILLMIQTERSRYQFSFPNSEVF